MEYTFPFLVYNLGVTKLRSECEKPCAENDVSGVLGRDQRTAYKGGVEQ